MEPTVIGEQVRDGEVFLSALPLSRVSCAPSGGQDAASPALRSAGRAP